MQGRGGTHMTKTIEAYRQDSYAQPRPAARRKRIAVVLVSAALVLGGGGAAFAYWTASGTGTGSAATGVSEDFSITSAAATGGPLSPDGPSQTIDFTVTNDGSGTQTLSSVVVTVANSDGTPWTAVAGCSAGDYSVSSAIPYGDILAGADVDGTVTLTMVNSGSNQDACQGETVPLYFVAS